MKVMGRKLASFLSVAVAVSCMGTSTFANEYKDEKSLGAAFDIECTTESALQLNFDPEYIVNNVGSTAPKNLQIPTLAYDDTSIVLVWEKPDNYANVKDYNVYMNGSLVGSAQDNFRANYEWTSAFMDAFQAGDVDDFHADTNIHVFRATGLEPDTSYEFTVRAVMNNGSESTSSNVITQKTTSTPEEFNILDFGAQDYGRITSYDDEINAKIVANTKAIQAAIDACSEGGKVVVPAGTYVSGALYLKSNMTLELEEGAVLLGSPNVDHYDSNYLLYDYSTDTRSWALLNAYSYDHGQMKNIRIVGEGTIDGNGWKYGAKAEIYGDGVSEPKYQGKDALDPTEDKYRLKQYVGGSTSGGDYTVDSKNLGILAKDAYVKGLARWDGDQKAAYSNRPNLIVIRGVENVYMENITMENPAFHGLALLDCDNVVSNGMKYISYDGNNADGIELGNTQNALVFGNFFDTGDDSINFATGLGMGSKDMPQRPTSNVWTFNNFLRNGHGGAIAAGSHTGGGIADMLVEDNIINKSEMPFRFKSAPENGGGIWNVTVRDCAVANSKQLVTMSTKYSDANQAIQVEANTEPAEFRNISFYNITSDKQSSNTIQVMADVVPTSSVEYKTPHSHHELYFQDIKLRNVTKKADLQGCVNAIFDNVTIKAAGGSDAVDPWGTIKYSNGLVFRNGTTMDAQAEDAMTVPTWGEDFGVEVNPSLNGDGVSFDMDMSWPTIENATAYVVETYVGNKMVNTNERGVNSLAATSYSETNLSVKVPYVFKLYAKDATGNKRLVSTIEVKALESGELALPDAENDTTSPAQLNVELEAATREAAALTAPDDLAVTVLTTGYTWADVQFAATKDQRVRGYEFWTDGKLVKTYYKYQMTGDPDTIKVQVGRLVPGQDNKIQVKAITDSGLTVNYDEAVATTWENYDSDAPHWNNGELTAEVVGEDVVLKWNAATDTNNILGYRVYMDGKAITAVEGDVFNPVNDKYTTNELTYTIKNVDLSKEHTFKVEAGDSWWRAAEGKAPIHWTLSGPSVTLTASGAEIDGFTWKGIAFGQSTDLNFSSTIAPEKVGINEARNITIQVDDNGTVSEVEAVQIESRGGKIANTHDGLTFYYTTLPTDKNFKLEADVYVNQFGPVESVGKTPSGQEAVGLMVRDVNGIPRKDPMEFGYEELPAASNVAATTIVTQGKTMNGYLRVQAYDRNGVVKPYGNVGATRNASDLIKFSATVQPQMTATEQRPSNGIYAKDDFVKLTLERTDDGFIMSYADSNGENVKSKEVSGADRVAVMDKDHMYVGFYASRNAEVTFTNIKLTVSDANTKEVGFEPDKEATYFKMLSSTTNSTEKYTVRAITNYDGTMTVTQDGKTIANNVAVKAGEYFESLATLAKEKTSFEVIFTPSEGKTPGVAVSNKFEVTLNNKYANKDLYVSLSGTNAGEGTIESPIDLETALDYITPGYTIYVREGNYRGLNIEMSHSGNKNAVKTLKAYNSEKVVFGASKLDGSYWHLDGIQVTGAPSTGLRLTGSYNTVENCLFYQNGDTGLQISAASINNPVTWPRDNTILNCESFNNRDASGINADGFAAKLGVGVNNLFKGCISHNNADDGWDLFNKLENYPNEPVTIDGCIAYENGLVEGYDKPTAGSIGNGFKLGGEGLPVDHILKNSIAFNNNMDGITCNFNPGQITVENCTSFDNARSNYIFRSNPYREPAEQGIFKNNISFRTDEKYEINDFISGNIYKSYFFADGNDTVKASDFVSVAVPKAFTRDKDNNIIFGNFLRLKSSSKLASAGVGGKHVGALAPIKESNPGGGSDSGSGSGSSGSSGSSNSGNNTTPVVTVTEAEMNKLIEAAIKDGKTEITLTGTNDKVVEVPNSLVNGETLGIEKVTVTFGKHSVTLPVEGLPVNAKENVYVVVKEQNKTVLNKEQQVAAGNDKVYNYQVLVGESYKTAKPVTELGELTELNVAYTKGEKQNPNTLTMFRVLEDGTLENRGGIYKDGVYTALVDVTGQFIIRDNAVSFKDVKETDKAYEAISFLASKGYVSGTKAGSFEPNKTMTRAEFTNLLARVLHLGEVKNAQNFSDIAANAWYTASINACYEAGLIKGVGENKFAPQQTISRQDMAALVVRAAEYRGIYNPAQVSNTVLNLTDGNTISVYAMDSVKALVDLGLLENSGSFRAKEAVTREEMAIMFEQLLKK